MLKEKVREKNARGLRFGAGVHVGYFTMHRQTDKTYLRAAGCPLLLHIFFEGENYTKAELRRVSPSPVPAGPETRDRPC